MSVVTTTRDGDIAIISTNNPPVNALGHAVRDGLLRAVLAADTDDSVKAIVIACEGRTFFAGADIREFGKPPVAPLLPEVVSEMEAIGTPTVAALFGTALGGGFEVAMGCHYRVALNTAKVGLPEVQLGILPGAGGTQRLPRLIGADKALDAIISGKHMPAAKMAEWGAVDKLVDDNLLEEAIAFAREIADQGPRPVGAMDMDTVKYDEAFFADFRKSIARRTRGYFAPEQCVKAVEAAVNLPIADGLARERELFAECMANPQSAAMRHMFFSARQISRIPGVTKENPAPGDQQKLLSLAPAPWVAASR